MGKIAILMAGLTVISFSAYAKPAKRGTASDLATESFRCTAFCWGIAHDSSKFGKLGSAGVKLSAIGSSRELAFAKLAIACDELVQNIEIRFGDGTYVSIEKVDKYLASPMTDGKLGPLPSSIPPNPDSAHLNSICKAVTIDLGPVPPEADPNPKN
jgi:hypothetical protein